MQWRVRGGSAATPQTTEEPRRDPGDARDSGRAGYHPPPAPFAPPPLRTPRRTDDSEQLAEVARRIRRHAVRMVGITGLGYLGQATSSAEMFAVLYCSVLRHGVDRFVLSPGHYVVPHYAAAVEAGILDESALETYGADGSLFESISTERTPLLSATCGALGQGLSVGAGLALADALDAEDRATYVFCSDGETQEGQLWEAAMFASHRGLARLTVLLDCNGSQVDGPVSGVVGIEPLVEKWRAFGWHAVEVDGHDVTALRRACLEAAGVSQPSAVLARTTMLHGLPSLGRGSDAHLVAIGAEGLRAALEDTGATADDARRGAVL
jgi:transketolase